MYNPQPCKPPKYNKTIFLTNFEWNNYGHKRDIRCSGRVNRSCSSCGTFDEVIYLPVGQIKCLWVENVLSYTGHV